MSPCKSGQPPSTSTRAKRGAETPRKVQQTKEDTTHIKQKDNVSRKDFKATELKRDGDVLPTIKSCSQTKVMWIQLFRPVLFQMPLKIVRFCLVLFANNQGSSLSKGHEGSAQGYTVFIKCSFSSPVYNFYLSAVNMSMWPYCNWCLGWNIHCTCSLAELES